MMEMESARGLKVAANTVDELGESPVWDAARGCLWWIDLRAPALHCLEPDGAVRTRALPDLVGAVVPAREGVLVGLPDGWWRWTGRALEPLAGFPGAAPRIRLNDAKIDARGRLWFGAMRDRGADRSGGLYVLEDGEIHCRRGGIRTPNALAVGPDGHRLSFTDTADGRIEMLDLSGSAPGGWRDFAAAGSAPGKPDGATFDAEGGLWNARYGAGCLARFAPDGRLDRLVALPVSRPTSCAFGGADLARLYVTTARQGLDTAALRAQPLAGAVLSFDPGVRGIPDHRFPF